MSSTPDRFVTVPSSPTSGSGTASRASLSIPSVARGALIAIGYVVLLAFAVAFLLPFLYMISASLRPNLEVLSFPMSLIPDQPGLGAYNDLFAGTAMPKWLFNSFFVTVTVTVLQIITSSMAGYAFARGSFPGKEAIFWVLMSAIMIPFSVTLIPAYILIARLHWVDTYFALIVPGAASIFGTFLCRQYVLGIPRTYDDAAIVDGCTTWGVYRRIHLPLMTPVLATLAVLTFLAHWNDFLWPLVVLQSNEMKTITVGLATMLTFEGGAAIRMAGATVTFIPTLIVFIILQRYVIQGFVLSGVKG